MFFELGYLAFHLFKTLILTLHITPYFGYVYFYMESLINIRGNLAVLPYMKAPNNLQISPVLGRDFSSGFLCENRLRLYRLPLLQMHVANP